MAWEARSGLKHSMRISRSMEKAGLNGLGSPFGIETEQDERLQAQGVTANTVS